MPVEMPRFPFKIQDAPRLLQKAGFFYLSIGDLGNLGGALLNRGFKKGRDTQEQGEQKDRSQKRIPKSKYPLISISNFRECLQARSGLNTRGPSRTGRPGEERRDKGRIQKFQEPVWPLEHTDPPLSRHGRGHCVFAKASRQS